MKDNRIRSINYLLTTDSPLRVKTKVKKSKMDRIRKNPFNAYSPITNSQDFVGRTKELIDACQSIANNSSILITGTRGIGKTSFCHQLINIMEDDHTILHNQGIKVDIELKSLIIYHICSSGDTIESILRSINSQLQEIDSKIKNIVLKSGVKIDFKIVKFEPTVNSQCEENKLSKITVDNLKKISLKYPSIAIILDEIERLDGANLPDLLKPIIDDRMLKSSVFFILSGIDGIEKRLTVMHESMRRVLKKIDIGIMSKNELCDILKKAEKKSNIQIKNKAKSKMIKLSGNYPDTFQKIGQEAFNITPDNIITSEIITEALKKIYDEYENNLPILNSLEDDLDKRLISFILNSSKSIVPYFELVQSLRADEDLLSSHVHRLTDQGIIKSDSDGIQIAVPLYKVFLQKKTKRVCYHCAGQKTCWRGSDTTTYESCIDCLKKAGYTEDDFGLRVTCSVCNGKGYTFKLDT